MTIEIGSTEPNSKMEGSSSGHSKANSNIYPEIDNTFATNQPHGYKDSVFEPQIIGNKYINHSRNPSSIAGGMCSTPPPNKPNAVDSLLKIIGLRDANGKSTRPKLCGAREARIIILIALLILFLISGTVFFVMWFTDYFNNSILSKLAYAKNSTALEYFINPPLNSQLRVHIFNYTNSDDFLNGIDKKLVLEEVGPFVYVEKVTKVNVVYHKNNTISYREHRSFRFRPELSGGLEYNQIVVPNIPMLTAAAQMRYAPFYKRLAISSAITLTSSKPFKELSAYEFMWGYKDELVEASKAFSTHPLPFDKFGMLVTRNGTSRESFTVHSGVGNLKKLNIIDNFNGKPKMNLWGTDECNRVDGTDGSQFPPYLMDKKQPLEVFIKAFCRKFPMFYDSEVNIFDGVPAWRYKAPTDVFDHPENNKSSNQCFCHTKSGTCAPSGVFNATLCFDAPIYSSYPHFLFGDRILFKKIEGLQPDVKKHLTYADIHPRLAFPMGGASRFQINVEVKKSNSISSLDPYDDNQILPVMWMEVTNDEIPEELRTILYHSTFSANALQLSLRYGSLLGCAVTLAILIATFYYKRTELMADEAVQTENQGDTKSNKEFETIDLNDKSCQLAVNST